MQTNDTKTLWKNLAEFPKKSRCFSFIFGKAMIAEREDAFLEVLDLSKKASSLAEGISFRTDKDFFSERLWRMQKYLVYFKESKGGYEEKDWLLRKESNSKVSQLKRRE